MQQIFGENVVTFEQLEDLFYQLDIEASVSGFHGFLCGRLCSGPVEMQDLIASTTQWLALKNEVAEAARDPLETFFESALTDLQDMAFIFQPLLPDDELPLPERLLAIGDWCSHYVSGLGEGIGEAFEVSGEGREALQDLAAIGQISSEFEVDDDGERDYLELVEYIRVAVQLIFADLNSLEETGAQPTHH
jgi:uncharacterized protein YgfB (UPF0149 family)